MNTNRINARVSVPIFLALSTLLGGCGYLTQARDAVPMETPREVARLQTLNPEASKNRKAVAGMDGAVARNVNESYQKTFQKKAPQGSNARAGLSYIGFEGAGGGD